MEQVPLAAIDDELADAATAHAVEDELNSVLRPLLAAPFNEVRQQEARRFLRGERLSAGTEAAARLRGWH